jgi:hypothetical protein
MIIDWTTGAIQQVPTQAERGVWNWSGVSASMVPTVGRPSWTLKSSLPQWELRESLPQWTLRPSLPQWELEGED